MKYHPPRPDRQRGAATLVVVMVLFFIMAMMATYSSRNLIFEQRIASNYYRSATALETAEAGAEWAAALLNGDLVDASCQPATTPPASSLRQRYLNIGSDRTIAPVFVTDNPVAACVNLASGGWNCQCPGDGVLSTPVLEAAAQLQPMFAVSFMPFKPGAGRAGVVQLRVQGCTDLLSNCLNMGDAARSDLALSTVLVQFALVSALKTPPAAPLVARRSVDLGAAGLGLHNTDPGLSGLLLLAGEERSGSTERMSSTPGTPAADALITEDPTLKNVEPDKMFALFFGMAPKTYSQQPAMRRVSCGNGDCASALQTAYDKGGRLFWVEGDTTIASNISLGSKADPFVLVVNGGLTLDGPMLLNGLVHVRGDASWSNSAGMPALLTGALISEGRVQAQGAVDIAYDATLINTLNNQRGSFVRVPGSWTDTSK